MKTMFVAVIVLFIFSVNAAEHSLAAHEHGSLKLGMAVEKNIVNFEVDGPAESFIGFEYIAKTESEKKIFNSAKELWVKKFLSLVFFDPKIGCEVTAPKFNQVVEGAHSDIEASATVKCKQDLKGQEVQILLRKNYTHIKKLVIEVVGTEIKSYEILQPIQVIKI